MGRPDRAGRGQAPGGTARSRAVDDRVDSGFARCATGARSRTRDAAFTAGRAALLGAAAASGSSELFAAALDDRLHEPYRDADGPLLREVRAELPPGALGATLSGSGPTVIVWAEADRLAACAAELRSRFGDTEVRELAVAASGACASVAP